MNQLKRCPKPAKSIRLTGMEKYSFIREIGPPRSVPGGETHTFQVRKILYMIDKVQANKRWHNGKDVKPDDVLDVWKSMKLKMLC